MKKPFFPILINNLIKLEKRMTSLLSNIITLHVVIKSICNCITLMVLRFSEKDMNIIACTDTGTPFWEQAKNIYAKTKMLTRFRNRNTKTLSAFQQTSPSCIWPQSTRSWNKHTFHNVTLSHETLEKYTHTQAAFMHSGKGNIYCYIVLKKEKTNFGGQFFSQICRS